MRDVPLAPGVQRRRAVGDPYSRVIPAISWLLLKAFFWRLWQKYVIRDFHPLVFFYVFGIAMFVAGLGLGIAGVVLRILEQPVPPATVVLVALLLLFGSQFTLFAMWFDLERKQGVALTRRTIRASPEASQLRSRPQPKRATLIRQRGGVARLGVAGGPGPRP